MDTIFGSGNGDMLSNSILLLGAFALSYSLWGGLASVAWTDVVQVIILIYGGILMTLIALTYVTPSGDIIDGLIYVYNAVPERFSMILSKGEIMIPDNIVNGEIIYKDAWFDLPGLAVLGRRLHDVGKSGWWILSSILILPALLLLYWLIIEGDSNPNEYGEVPTNTLAKEDGINYNNY